jgi:molecular chaperone GrpE
MENEEKKEENINNSGPGSGESAVPGDVKPEEDLKAEMEKINKERDEYLNGWRRAKADLINFKKDETKRFEEMARFSNEDILKDLISVLHSFDLGMIGLDESNVARKGLYMIRGQLEDVLGRRGLVRIKVEIGKNFDPIYHEAIDMVEKEGLESGTVAEEVKAGYMLNGKVLKAALVKVVK